MKILVLLSNDAEVGYLVKLQNDGFIKELRQLIGERKNTKAMIAAISRGIIEKLIDLKSAKDINADLVLTQESACWNAVSS